MNAHRLGGALVAFVGLAAVLSQIPVLGRLLADSASGIPVLTSVAIVIVGLLLFEVGALALSSKERLSRRRFK